MPTLVEALLTDARREHLVGDCVQLVRQHLASRGMLRKAGLTAGLAVLNTIKPNALPRAVGSLLPDFAAALDPLYQRFAAQSAPGDFSPFLLRHSDEAVQALLAVTDRRAGNSAHAAVRSAYARLRGAAEDEVREALPGLARVLSRHLPVTPAA